MSDQLHAQSPTPLTLPAADDFAAWLDRRCADGLASTRDAVRRLKAGEASTAEQALRIWDTGMIGMANAAAVGSLFSEVHPDEAVRDRGDAAVQEVQKLGTELQLDRELYDVFAALDAAELDPEAARLLDKTLLDFRRSGVDRDDATRARIKEINEQLTLVGQEFGKNIRDGKRTISVAPARLAGLPQDWLDAHPVGDDGLVTLTTDYPDAIPVRTFCHDRDVRREMVNAFLNVGWPANEPLLRELFELREELARLVGYDTWADYDAGVKMIGKGVAIPEFIDRITEAATEPAERDRDILLARLRLDHPGAEAIDGVDVVYYEELVRKEQYDVDAQVVRTYFDFSRVRAGLLEVTSRLFDLTYTPVDDAVVWHPDVTAYDVTLGGETLGRIYLDLHPRENKYNHAAQFTITDGVAGHQQPEGVLVCNFPKGLMEHDDVVTLFHEFGHLVHHILAGRATWSRFAGVATEWDFVEAPSQLLEEWAWDAGVLQTFAKNAEGEPIPADLVAAMRRADDFGKGYMARTQMFYAAMSYWFHTDLPDDLTEATVSLQDRYSMFRYVEDTHMFSGFGHLDGYSSGYYTYMWSLVIAKDLFSAFDPDDLFAPEVAHRYRDLILAPGGTRDAADLVQDFLGRPYTFDAYGEWLAR
ncbi:Zn-dependent oligopeptidase [Nocardioides agariphilus]|uniref:Zn-dependent oligopeptidase n=2 Tax=Nocardioides agariphilus TaxID=433664 RepID=A0A930VLU1_9ACTN|nr:Zn-dependent oligopeptidase [Nocardioides agariphilus]